MNPLNRVLMSPLRRNRLLHLMTAWENAIFFSDETTLSRVFSRASKNKKDFSSIFQVFKLNGGDIKINRLPAFDGTK